MTVFSSTNEMYETARSLHNVPEMLKAFRELHKLTKTKMVEWLARHGVIGINWSTYQRWESGKHTPRGLSRDAIEKALDKIEDYCSTVETISKGDDSGY